MVSFRGIYFFSQNIDKAIPFPSMGIHLGGILIYSSICLFIKRKKSSPRTLRVTPYKRDWVQFVIDP